MPNISLVGKHFGRLLAVADAVIIYGGRSYPASKCECLCGGTKTVLNSNLKNGLTESCGCLKLEKLVTRSTVHGFASRKSRHPIYNKWKGMRARCYDPNNTSWKDYGGRGITVCDEWLDFENFKNDMFPSWRSSLTIERIDNNKGYSKENCIWMEKPLQSKHRRNVPIIEYGGKKMNRSEWGVHLGGTCDLIYVRVRRGWSMERALSTPA